MCEHNGLTFRLRNPWCKYVYQIFYLFTVCFFKALLFGDARVNERPGTGQAVAPGSTCLSRLLTPSCWSTDLEALVIP